MSSRQSLSAEAQELEKQLDRLIEKSEVALKEAEGYVNMMRNLLDECKEVARELREAREEQEPKHKAINSIITEAEKVARGLTDAINEISAEVATGNIKSSQVDTVYGITKQVEKLILKLDLMETQVRNTLFEAEQTGNMEPLDKTLKNLYELDESVKHLCKSGASLSATSVNTGVLKAMTGILFSNLVSVDKRVKAVLKLAENRQHREG